MRINISRGDHDINDILEAEEEYYNDIDEVGEDIEAAHGVCQIGDIL